MILELCALLFTVAFIILCVFLVQTLFSVQKTLQGLDSTLTKVNAKIDPLSVEAIKLIHSSNQLTTQLNEQIHTISPLTESMSEIGEVIQNITSSFQQERKPMVAEEKSKRVGDILEIAGLGISLLQQVNKRR